MLKICKRVWDIYGVPNKAEARKPGRIAAVVCDAQFKSGRLLFRTTKAPSSSSCRREPISVVKKV
jgi:hypothetical protein